MNGDEGGYHGEGFSIYTRLQDLIKYSSRN